MSKYKDFGYLSDAPEQDVTKGFQNREHIARYERFSEFVEMTSELDSGEFKNFTELGEVTDRGDTIFDHKGATDLALEFLLNFYGNEDVIDFYKDERDRDVDPCILFCTATNPKGKRCYITLSGHFHISKTAAAVKLRKLVKTVCEQLDLKNKKKKIRFKFGQNDNVYDANHLIYKGCGAPFVNPPDYNDFTRTCAEKSMMILLCKKFYHYGTSMKVTGMVACNLQPQYSLPEGTYSRPRLGLAKFLSQSGKSRLFFHLSININREGRKGVVSIQDIFSRIKPTCPACKNAKKQMLTFWRVSQLLGNQIKLSLSPHFSDREIRKMKRLKHVKDKDFFNQLISKLPDDLQKLYLKSSSLLLLSSDSASYTDSPTSLSSNNYILFGSSIKKDASSQKKASSLSVFGKRS